MTAERIILGSMICVFFAVSFSACAKPRPEPVMPDLPAISRTIPAETIVKDVYEYAYEPALCADTEQFLAAENKVAPPLPEKAIKFHLQQLPAASDSAQKHESIHSIKSKNNGLTLFFDISTSALNKKEAAKLRHIIKKLPSAAEVEITGYTCRLGTDPYNRKLAMERARAVARIFKKHGVRVRSVTGKSGCCFISNTDPSKNRRAEIQVRLPDSSTTHVRGGE